MSLKVRFFTLLMTSTLMSGCLVSEDSKDLFAGRNVGACEAAQPFAFDGIALRFNIPEDSLDFRLTRDGSSIFQTSDRTQNQYADTNLIPGQTYRYRCEAMVDRDRGFQQVGEELTVTLPSTIPPTFDGLESVTLQGNDQVLLEWDLIADTILSHFKVFKVIDPASSNSEFPASEEIRLNDLFANSALVTDLGDELTYSFRVSACNTSDVCDNNNSILSVTTPDTGPPLTQGATDISIVNQQVVLTAPWTDSDGGLSRRTVYRANVATGTPCPTDFGSFSEVNSFFITNQRNTPTRLTASGTLNEGSKYCFVVRDQDPSGNEETNFNVQEVTIGDLTVPNFLSQVSLVRDTNSVENNLIASWTAMANEQESALEGAHEYLLYLSSVAAGQPLPDACDGGTLFQTVSAASFASGQTITVNIGGLAARSANRVCVQARDSSGNLSPQSPQAFARTGDITPPPFSGIQSVAFNPAQRGVDIFFVVPSASDLQNYIITGTRRRGSVTTDLSPVFEVLPPQSPGSTAQTFVTLNTLNAEDGDVLTISVDACDNANPDFNSVDNCSNTAASQTIIIPDATPPQAFQGVTTATPGPGHRSVELSWPAPPSWDDYAGFRAYYVNASGLLVSLNSADCVCIANDCSANPITSCTVDREESGGALTPSRNYEFYVSAYDSQSNETRSYLPHTGPGARTRFSRTADTVAPIFNATVSLAINNGVDVTFDQAVDEQDSSLELTYEIYRREDSTFLCPLTPFDAAGGCDNLTPYAVVTASNLADAPSNRKLFNDTAISDGFRYFYQVCAVDFASNRSCQTGSIADITVEDTTPPVITNAVSQKRADGSTTWTVNFEVSDNVVEPANLLLSVYKSTTAFPDPMNLPGSPDILNQDITRNAQGDAGFTDSGTADVPSVYYLIVARDLNGNEAYATIRDMLPLPIITSVEWPDPINSAGFPKAGLELTGAADYWITIRGTGLSSISAINESNTPADDGDRRHCMTSRITSQTDTEIICQISSRTYMERDYTLYMTDSFQRSIVYNSGSPLTFCEYADLNGITELRGEGTEENKYALCRPEHFNLIGRNADNPNNSEDIIGYFEGTRDIDFSGVTDFTGIPVMQAGEFFLNMNDFFIRNLTIDTSATNEDAAFVLGCVGQHLGTTSFMTNVQFDNATIRTGTGRAAVMLLEKNCDWAPNERFIESSGVANSQIYANNTAGLISAEYTANQDDIIGVILGDSTIYSTRPDNTTAVGSAFGKFFSNATFDNPIIFVRVNEVELRPAPGQSDAGYNIGGLTGELSGDNVIVDPVNVNNIDIIGGLRGVGGVIGSLRGNADNLTLTNGDVVNLNIDNTGSIRDYRAGLIGEIPYPDPIGGVPDNITIDAVEVRNLTLIGEDFLGGMFSSTGRARGIRIVNGSSVRGITITGEDRIGGVMAFSDRGSDLVISDMDIGETPVTLNGSSQVGGVIGGSFNTTIDISDVSVRNLNINALGGGNIGGLMGFSDQQTISVTRVGIGDSTINGNSAVGGIFGTASRNNLTLTDSYTSPSVVVSGNTATGGILGRITSNTASRSVEIRRNVALGATFLGNSDGGAFMGQYAPEPGQTNVFSNNYFKNDHSGSNVMNDNTAYQIAGEVEGLNTSELSNQSSFVNWDFVDTWQMTGGGDRPVLQIFTGVPEL